MDLQHRRASFTFSKMFVSKPPAPNEATFIIGILLPVLISWGSHETKKDGVAKNQPHRPVLTRRENSRVTLNRPPQMAGRTLTDPSIVTTWFSEFACDLSPAFCILIVGKLRG